MNTHTENQKRRSMGSAEMVELLESRAAEILKPLGIEDMKQIKMEYMFQIAGIAGWFNGLLVSRITSSNPKYQFILNLHGRKLVNKIRVSYDEMFDYETQNVL